MALEENHITESRRLNIKIREMDIDDLPKVFHLGEKLFMADKVPNLYRTWDEYKVVELFNADSDFCLVAEFKDDIPPANPFLSGRFAMPPNFTSSFC